MNMNGEELQQLLEICATHLIELLPNGTQGQGTRPIIVVSAEGLNHLRALGFDDMTLLGLVKSPDTQIDDTLKKQLLYGLLLQREGRLSVLEEDGRIIIAPLPEISIPALVEGSISFLDDINLNIDTRSFCCYRSYG